MLPGRKYTPEAVLRIARTRIWLILLPFAIVSAAVAVAGLRLPNRYRSETTILVVPQRVPESYVKSTVTTRIEDRLHSIAQQILSRTRLERIVQDFNLYQEERRLGLMEDVIERMRRDIGVQVVKGDAFRVTYSGQSPAVVQKVTERLASLFIEENLRDRAVLAEGTSQFLEAQLAEARTRLVNQEKKLETYRKQYSGQLPTQLNSNLQVIQNTQMQVQALAEALNRDRDRRLILERMIADLTAPAQAKPAAADPADVDAARDLIARASEDGPAVQRLEEARAALRAMETRLRPEHPDIVAAKRILATLEVKAAEEAKQAPERAAATAAMLPRDRRLAELRREIDQIDLEIVRKAGQEQRLRQISADYQRRVEAVPSRESELAELMRDYTTLQTLYTSLLAKKEESIMAANLERRQIGEQFKVLDPARLPEKPYSPNRVLIDLGGMVAGLFIGLALVALLEYRDSSFRTDEEIVRLLKLPVLATIATMHTKVERRHAFARRMLVQSACTAIVVGCAGVVIYTLVR